MRKRFLIPLAVLITAGLAGGAYAAGQGSSDPQQALINDAARRLHISPSQLSGALKQALIDRVNAAAAAGQLSRAQAKEIIAHIQQGSGLPFGPGPMLFAPGARFRMFGAGPMLFGAHAKGGPMFVPAPIGIPPFGPPEILHAAASYLGLSDKQLLQDLSHGKSLAQIAQAQGKTKGGLEQALMTAITAQLSKVQKAGRGIPQGFEQKLLDRIRQNLPQLLTMSPQVQKLAKGGAIAVAPGGPPGAQVKIRAGGPPPFPFLAGLLGLIPRFHVQMQSARP
jgi:hypothetical protein